MIKAARFRAGEKRKRDDAHCFLGVVRAVTMRHPRGDEDLEFAESGLDKMRCEPMQRDYNHKDTTTAENEPGNWRSEHRHDNFRPHSGAPFYYRPISARGRNCCAAKSADERMT